MTSMRYGGRKYLHEILEPKAAMAFIVCAVIVVRNSIHFFLEVIIYTEMANILPYQVPDQQYLQTWKRELLRNLIENKC